MALIAIVLHQVVSKQSKHIAVLLALAACCFILGAAIESLEPVFAFFNRLQSIGNLDADMITVLLKAVGIGLLAEIASGICTDAGNSAIGKAIQLMAVSVILLISLPLFSGLIELMEDILGNL